MKMEGGESFKAILDTILRPPGETQLNKTTKPQFESGPGVFIATVALDVNRVLEEASGRRRLMPVTQVDIPL